jgi:hypothetical protein
VPPKADENDIIEFGGQCSFFLIRRPLCTSVVLCRICRAAQFLIIRTMSRSVVIVLAVAVDQYTSREAGDTA